MDPLISWFQKESPPLHASESVWIEYNQKLEQKKDSLSQVLHVKWIEIEQERVKMILEAKEISQIGEKVSKR